MKFTKLKGMVFSLSFITAQLLHAQDRPAINIPDIEEPFRANFELLVNHKKEQNFDAQITIYNLSGETLKNWQVGFTFVRPILKLDVMENVYPPAGDFNLLKPIDGCEIPPGGSFTFKLKGAACIKHLTDAPRGFFIVKEGGETIPFKGDATLPSWKASNIYKNYQEQLQFDVEGNNINNCPPQPTYIVPLPAHMTVLDGNFEFRNNMPILYENGNMKTRRAAWEMKQALEGMGHIFKVQKKLCKCSGAYISFEAANDAKLGDEGYTLTISENEIIIRANERAGYFYAMQSLKQLIGPDLFSSCDLEEVRRWYVPMLDIKDYPRFGYRGVLLDSARHFFTVNEVKNLLSMMALLKLNHLHWHLSDDEGWRVAIDQYPQLTAIGSKRGFAHPLTPSLGSGPDLYGGYYSKQDIKEIVIFAQEMCITIIPEIDVPAHARALIQSMGPKASNPLLDPNDQSVYTSVQGYHDNVLNPCKMTTYTVLANIFEEISEMFPGQYISVGGDEQPDGAWTRSPLCGYKGIEPVDKGAIAEIQGNFFANLQKILKNLGKGKNSRKLAGWENTLNGHVKLNPEKTLIYAWTGKGEAGIRAAKAGYDVVMAPAQFLYFDLTYSDDPREFGNYWAGSVNAFSAYSFSPLSKKLSRSDAKRIKGVEGTLWSELLFDYERLEYMAHPKLAALCEVAWTQKKRRNWKDFTKRVGRQILPIYDALDVNYRISPPGVADRTDLKATIEYPSGYLRFTLNGQRPTIDSVPYPTPFQTRAEDVRMLMFNILKLRGNLNETGYPGIEVPIHTGTPK